MAALEAAALSGELFQPRSNSPTRSESTSSPINTDDELGSDLDQDDEGGPDNSSKAYLVDRSQSTSNQFEHQGNNTGPKGVIADQKAYKRVELNNRQNELRELNKRIEKEAIIGQTWKEEEESRLLAEKSNLILSELENEEIIEKWRKKRKEQLERFRLERQGGTGLGVNGVGKAGLKEVGKEGFVAAVEKKGWVVVLIYEPDLPRCQSLLTSLLSLSLSLPSMHLQTPIALLRARATTLSFSLLPSSRQSHPTRSNNDGDAVEEEDEEDETPQADPDVLPSILAYKDGELEKTWIRVDWEIGEGGVEGLLRRHGILPSVGKSIYDGVGNDSADEDE